MVRFKLTCSLSLFHKHTIAISLPFSPFFFSHYAGPAGGKGSSGPPGATGATGPIGQKGDTGPQGLKGASGPVGQKGVRGPQGPSGSTGAKGNTGSTGSRGPSGPPGATGSTGSRGSTGPRGPPGSGGAKGQKGERGLCPIPNCGNCNYCKRRKRDLNSESEKEVPLPTDVPGVVYTIWGESNCLSNSTKTVYSGSIVSSATGDHICLPHSGNRNGQKYMSDDDEPVTIHQTEIPCATCLALEKSTTFTLPKKTTCPPGWTTEYFGYYMSNYVTKNGQVLCVYDSGEKNSGGKDVSLKDWFRHIKIDCNDQSKECSNNVLSCTVCTL